MAGTSAGTNVSLDELAGAVREIEARLSAVEQHIGVARPATAAAAVPAVPTVASGPAAGEPASLFPLFGKALLGLSGAYLLRALTEAKALPVPAGVSAGVLYAAVWLWLAARASAAHRSKAALYALTSALILVPLLWEARVRFEAAPSGSIAAVLVFFPVFGSAIAWRKNIASIAWVTTLAGAFTAGALILATHDLVPFTAALVGIAAVLEISACLDHWLRERWVVALSADLSVVLLTYIATRPGGLPPGYAAIPTAAVVGLQIALLVIYLSSAIVRTLWRGFPFTGFEIVQCVLAFTISTSGAMRAAQGVPRVTLAVAAFCLAAGLACYLVSFAFLVKLAGKDRNFHTYATFALLLVLSGAWLAFDREWLVVFSSALAVAAVAAGRHATRVVLLWHGFTYAAFAGLLSGLTGSAAAMFLEGGAHSSPALPPAAAWVAAGAAIVAYAFAPRSPGGGLTGRVVLTFLAAGAGWALASMFAAVLPACPRAGGIPGAADYCPTLFMAALTSVSVGFAIAASRLRRPELMWSVYLLMSVTTYKLVIQDLRQEQALAIVVSLLLYGGSLVLLPRIAVRRGA